MPGAQHEASFGLLANWAAAFPWRARISWYCFCFIFFRNWISSFITWMMWSPASSLRKILMKSFNLISSILCSAPSSAPAGHFGLMPKMIFLAKWWSWDNPIRMNALVNSSSLRDPSPSPSQVRKRSLAILICYFYRAFPCNYLSWMQTCSFFFPIASLFLSTSRLCS